MGEAFQPDKQSDKPGNSKAGVSKRELIVGLGASAAALFIKSPKAQAQQLTSDELLSMRNSVSLEDFIQPETVTNERRKDWMRQVLEHVGGKFEEAPANSRFAGGRCFTLYNRQAIARVRYSRDGADKFEIVRQIAPRLIATCEIFRGSTERESMACHIRVLGPRLPDNFLITELQKLSDNPTGSEVFEVLAKLSSQPRAIDATCSTKTGELVSSGITTPMTIIPEELKRLGAENKLTSGEIEIVLKEDLESSFSDKIADKDKAKQLAERIFGGIIFHFLPQI